MHAANRKPSISEKLENIHPALKKAYERILKIRDQPREIALGFSLGVFIGMSPTLGVQTLIAVFTASLLKWNKIAAAIGVWISNPLTAPVIYSVTYVIGAQIIGVAQAPVIGDEFSETPVYDMIVKAPEILFAMAIGGVITGLPLAVTAHFFAFKAVSRYQDDIRRKLAARKEKKARRKEAGKQKRSPFRKTKKTAEKT